MKTKNNTHENNTRDNIKKTDSRNNIRSKIAGLATLAFLAYAPNALALNAQPHEQQQKKQVVVQKVMPELQFKTYDAQGKTLEDWVKLAEKHILYPPFVVPYGGSFELTYQNMTTIHDNIALDVLISDLKGNYLNNSKPLQNRGPRAFPTKINTKEAGMMQDTFYAFFPSKEKAASLELREVGQKPSKEILASAMGLLYVQGQCPPPEIREVIREVTVPVEGKKPAIPPSIAILTTEKEAEVKKDPCNERGSLLMIAPFYTDKKNFGGDFTIEKRISKDIMLGIGGFIIPNAKQRITTNMQHDEYTVRGVKLLGETNLLTEREWEAYGLLLNAFFGDQCKFMVGVEGGIGWQKNHFKHTLRQTVEEVDTKKLLDEYVCKAGGDDINKMIYRVGAGLLIPLSKNNFYLQLGGGVFGNLPKTTEVSFYNGNIKKTLDLGLETMGYAKLGIAFKF